MTLDSSVKDDLTWWLTKLPTASCPIRSFQFVTEIYSDASLLSWGAHCNGQNAHGFWSESERKLHINHLELIAAFFGLKCFAQEYKNAEILLRIDNTTAIAYINRLGGVQYPELNRLARDIWQWCEQKKLWIFASYIPSKENTDADRESRRSNIDTEWELGDSFFGEIARKWKNLEIDLFAMRVNAKIQKFCSWKRDPEAFCIDAFTMDWGNYFFYAFPPFSMIMRVLRKIRLDRAEGIVVVPYWPTQPWFPVFTAMLTEDPLIFLPSIKLLLSPCRSLEHPLIKHLSLVAGKLSGRHTGKNNYQRKLLKFSSHLELSRQSSNIIQA
ncbi:uncharacterized protein LOC128667832 [Microplitis demolitor]|uniref:uncharacterized protein LOC128667832 n=1 Tax=Microplitis demolitor TaxID=69319 RepID=UPI0004CD24B6|nr:uncharacterized protein LOC128667832 [Microplitis demolitor]